MATTTAKAKQTVKDTGSTMAEMNEQAFKNWEKALRSGIKLQEQAGQWWSESLNTVSVVQDWQKRMFQFSSLASEMIPQTQKQLEQAMEFTRKNVRTAADLYKRAVDATNSPVLPEKDSKWMDLWSSSLNAARNNTEAIMQMNNQAISSWMHFMRKADTVEAQA